MGSVNFDYLYNFVNQRTDTSVDDNAYLWLPDLGASNSYLSNELNQYDDVDGTLYTYDGNGNLTDDGVNSYLYDVESRLISATTPQHLADYTYDPFGRRSEKDVDATVTKYVYAGDTVIAEYDGLDQLQARYIPGPGVDRPVLMDRGGALSYYHYDGSGSVVAATDGFGVVAERYAYSPYGDSSDPDTIGNPYRYTGRRLDAETGLYYYRNRYYSVALGRFLQADPAGFVDGLNLYAYVGNDPLNFVDPSGLFVLTVNVSLSLVFFDDIGIQLSGGIAFDSSTFEVAVLGSEATDAAGLMFGGDLGIQLFPDSRLHDIENPTEVIGGGLGIGGAAIFDARTGDLIGGELTFGPSAGAARTTVNTNIQRLGRVDPYDLINKNNFDVFGRANASEPRQSFGFDLGLSSRYDVGSVFGSGSLGK